MMKIDDYKVISQVLQDLRLGFICLDLSFSIVEINDSALELLGIDNGSSLKNVPIYNVLEVTKDASVEPNNYDIITSNLHESEVKDEIVHIKNVGNGFRQWINLARRIVFDEQGKPIYIHFILKDYSKEKAKELKIKSRLGLEEIVSEISTQFIDADYTNIGLHIDDALQKIGLYTHIGRSYVFTYNTDKTAMSCVNEWCADGVSEKIDNLGELDVDAYPWWQKQMTEMAVVNIASIEDLPHDAQAEKEIFRAYDIKSLMVVPITSSQEVIGFMGFDSVNEIKSWTKDEIRLLGLVAEIISSAFNSVKTQKLINKSNDHFKSLVESINSAVFVSDINGRYLYANKILLSHWGLTLDQFIGSTVYDYFSRDVSDALIAKMKEVIESGESISEEDELCINGYNSWYRNSIHPIIENGETSNKLLVISEDIYEQKNSEMVMARLNKRINGLHQIDRALIHQFSGGGDIINLSLNHLYDMVPAKVVTFTHINLSTGWIEMSDNYLWDGVNLEKSFPRFKLSNFEPNAVEDLKNFKTFIKRYDTYNPDSSYHKLLINIGIKSSIYVPLKISDDILAVVVLQSEQIDFFTDEYVAIVEEVVREIQIGVNQQQLYKKIQLNNQELESLVEKRTQENMELNSFNSLIVESSGVAIMSMDDMYRITQLNPKAEELLGYKVEEVLGLDAFSTSLSDKEVERIINFSESQSGNTFTTVQTAIDYLTSNSTEVEINILHKDGREIPVLINIAHIFDDSGKLKHRIAVAVDITERLEAEERLRSSEARWHIAVENSGEGIWDWNVEKNDVFYSIQSKNMIGYRDEEISEQVNEWYDRIHPDDLTQVDKEVQKYMDGESPIYISEYRVKCKNGHYIWIMDRGKAIDYDENGKPSRIIGTHTDISRRKAYEKSLVDALRKEKELNELKSQFVSMTSHEFRTPLASILMTTDSLSQYWDKMKPEEIEQKLSRISNNVDFLSNILEKVLSLSHLESGKMSFTPEFINIYDELNSILHDDGTIEFGNRKISFECPDENVGIYADRQMIRQVINNILSNACKFSPVDSSIYLKVNVLTGSVLLTVQDEGIGIKKSDIKDVFRPFKRGTNVGNIHGTGLGLALSSEFVKWHGGAIDVESKVGKGSLFKVLLPKVPTAKNSYMN